MPNVAMAQIPGSVPALVGVESVLVRATDVALTGGAAVWHDITGLTFASAIGSYRIKGVLFMTSGGETMSLGINGPAATSLTLLSAEFGAVYLGNAITAYDTAFGLVDATSPRLATFEAALVLAAVGTVALRVLPSGDGSTLTIKKGSYVAYQQTA